MKFFCIKCECVFTALPSLVTRLVEIKGQSHHFTYACEACQ